MTHFSFKSTFGASLEADGAVFRIWAPSARSIALEIDDRPPLGLAHQWAPTKERLWRSIGLERDESGFAEARVAGVGAGTLYRYRVDGGLAVPDPASRFQPHGVHGPSEVIDPAAYRWRSGAFCGRPWHEAVVYELHLGAFTLEGTAAAAIARLDELVRLGVTAVELMPVAASPGAHNWGYDGVSLFAPDRAYGRPDDLKALIDAAHERGLMMLLDVVYNHFGPDGNYLHTYAQPMFDEDAHTPWGAGIAVDGPRADVVRRFFIDNALFWLEEYRFDGLRLDAVHALPQGREPSFLEELATEVNAACAGREVHLVLENDDNRASLLERRGGRPVYYRAQWNDDVHHALHRLVTGESDGYYGDYDPPLEALGRCLAEGFAYQGEESEFRGGRRRGEPSASLPPTAFVAFLQNHDQIGNRAFGERITSLCRDPAALEAATAITLLSPQIPLLFMGQEWDASSPFLFFCDFPDPELERAVRDGRRREFARFAAFADEKARDAIPDPCLASTFAVSRLDWGERSLERHRAALERSRELLAIRRREIVPRLPEIASGRYAISRGVLRVEWPVGGRERLVLELNASGEARERRAAPGERLLATAADATADRLPPWGLALAAVPTRGDG